MNWFELSVKVGADESVPVSLPTIYSKTTERNDKLVGYCVDLVIFLVACVAGA